ncbi:MAG: hypothetical protein BGO03_11640 [Mesorhizobium sp. 61-13]|nr:MAG: hypothetical protein BGO03_11640 [Mesorhizobium sp. 61-13]
MRSGLTPAAIAVILALDLRSSVRVELRESTQKYFRLDSDDDCPTIIGVQVDNVITTVEWPQKRNFESSYSRVAFEFRKPDRFFVALRPRIKSSVHDTNSPVGIKQILGCSADETSFEAVFYPTHLMPSKITTEIQLPFRRDAVWPRQA